MPTSNPATENIDPIILRIIGLDDVFDIDYDTYLTLLKEAMVRGRMLKTSISTEENDLLNNEYKRVKSKKNSGTRFVIKKKKISSRSFFSGRRTVNVKRSNIKLNNNPLEYYSELFKLFKGNKLLPPQTNKKLLLGGSKTQKMLPEGENRLDKAISDILDILKSILKTLKNKFKLEEKNSSYLKRQKENKDRELKENELESKFFVAGKIVKKILTPVKSLLDKLISFFLNIFIGRALIKMIDWMADPKNASKLNSIIRFLVDFSPAIFGGFLLFGTSLGKFIRTTTKLLTKFIFKIGKFAIPKLLRFIAKNPKAAAAVALFTAGAYVPQLLPDTVNSQERKTKKLPGTKEEKISKLKEQKSKLNFFEKLQGKGAEIDEQIYFLETGVTKAYNSGGFVSGEKGIDKVPAMLSDGEFVMSRGAVAKYGIKTLEAMNAAGGGTNIPKEKGGKVFAAGGGLIGDIPLDTTYGSNPDSNTLRRAARLFSKHFGNEDELVKVFTKLNGVPNIIELVGGDDIYGKIFQGHYKADDKLDSIRKSVSDKLKLSNINKPQSFTESSRAISGLNDLTKKMELDYKTSPRYGKDLPTLSHVKNTPIKNNTPKNIKLPKINTKVLALPAAGQSSASKMMSKPAEVVRTMIPPERSIVPYSGNNKIVPVNKITNKINLKNISGIKTLGAELLLNYLVDSGLDYIEAKRLSTVIENARNEPESKRILRIQNLRELIHKEESHQKGLGGFFEKVIKLGGETGSEKLAKQAKIILSGLGSNSYQGGGIKGGYNLKEQSFEDMPKTQIMLDDKGVPFVGYKAMRAGKPVYVRGSKPGSGTTNPIEMIGRMINPKAYENNDKRMSMNKHKIALVNALESFQERGMAKDAQAKMIKKMGGNLKDVQNDLDYRKKQNQIQLANAKSSPKIKPDIKPPVKSQPKVITRHHRRAKTANNRNTGITGSSVPKFNAKNRSRSNTKQLGITG